MKARTITPDRGHQSVVEPLLLLWGSLLILQTSRFFLTALSVSRGEAEAALDELLGEFEGTR